MSPNQQPPNDVRRPTQPKLLEQVRDLCRTQHLSIRTIQELLGHQDLSTTMVYTHVSNVGPSGVVSPLDRL